MESALYILKEETEGEAASSSSSYLDNDTQKHKRFQCHDTVEGNYIGGVKWFPAKIRRVNGDGTYDLDYDVSRWRVKKRYAMS